MLHSDLKGSNTASTARPPLWGNFIHHADEDLLAFGLRIQGGMMPLGHYHGVQAIEKYLKALVLSVRDPAGTSATALTEPRITHHDLVRLARDCQPNFPEYVQPAMIHTLERFKEFDRATRYPWVDQTLGNGFNGADIKLIGDLCKKLRQALPPSLQTTTC